MPFVCSLILVCFVLDVVVVSFICLTEPSLQSQNNLNSTLEAIIFNCYWIQFTAILLKMLYSRFKMFMKDFLSVSLFLLLCPYLQNNENQQRNINIKLHCRVNRPLQIILANNYTTHIIFIIIWELFDIFPTP